MVGLSLDGHPVVSCMLEPGKPDLCGVISNDCSDASFDCYAGTDIFAVPKAGLRSGLRYEVAGAILTVESCETIECTEAIISTNCATPELCNCRKGSSHPPKAYFTYRADRGLISFYVLGPPATPQDVFSRTYVLAKEKGFFRKQLSLPRFSNRCANEPAN